MSLHPGTGFERILENSQNICRQCGLAIQSRNAKSDIKYSKATGMLKTE